MLVGMDPRSLLAIKTEMSLRWSCFMSEQIQTKSLTLSWELLSLLDDCFTAGLENGMLCNHRKAFVRDHTSVVIPRKIKLEKLKAVELGKLQQLSTTYTASCPIHWLTPKLPAPTPANRSLKIATTTSTCQRWAKSKACKADWWSSSSGTEQVYKILGVAQGAKARIGLKQEGIQEPTGS